MPVWTGPGAFYHNAVCAAQPDTRERPGNGFHFAHGSGGAFCVARSLWGSRNDFDCVTFTCRSLWKREQWRRGERPLGLERGTLEKSSTPPSRDLFLFFK